MYRLVGLKVAAVVNHRRDGIVVERPQRGIAEAFVVAGHLLSSQRHLDEVTLVNALGHIGRNCLLIARATTPTNLGARMPTQCTVQRRHQSPGRAHPCGAAVSLVALHREAVGDHDHVVGHVCVVPAGALPQTGAARLCARCALITRHQQTVSERSEG